MTNDKFIEEVCELYKNAGNTHPRLKAGNIIRGRKHTVSSQAEDLMAFFLSSRLVQSGYEFWIDYPISFRHTAEELRTKTIYADIAVVKRIHDAPTIIHIVDLKMDLGWKRDLTETLNNAFATTALLRVIGRCECWYEASGTRNRIEVKISPSLQWHIVTISDQNGSEKYASSNHTLAESLRSAGVCFYTLSKEQHPNGGKPVCNHHDFKLLLDNLS